MSIRAPPFVSGDKGDDDEAYLLSIYQPDGDPPPPEVLGDDQTRARTSSTRRSRPPAPGSSAGGLHAPSTATVVRRQRRRASLMTDGPYVEGKEHIGGFWIIEAPDLDAALGWARKAARAITAADRGAPVPGPTPSTDTGLDQARASEIERVFRAEYGRAVAVLVRVFGDIDLAEEAVAGRVRRGRRALAGRRAAAEPGRLDHHHRPQPRDRPAAPRGLARRPPRPGGAAARRGDEPAEEGPVPRRPAAADLHLLPPGARPPRPRSRSRCACSAASRPRRSRARSWCPRRRWRSGWCAPRARSATRGSRTACPDEAELPARLRSVLAVVYLVFNEGYAASSGDGAGARRPLRRGDPPRPAARRADARRARGAGPARADAARRVAPRGAHRPRTARWCRSPSRTAAAGTAR